jgi:ribosome-associated protein
VVDAEALRLTKAAASAADSVKAEQIAAIDVTSRLPLTDVFVLASGKSERQVSAIAEAVEEQLLLEGAKPVRREGRSGARWVLLDFGVIVVHVMHVDDREFYALDKLWEDCPLIELDPLIPAEPGARASLKA